MLSSTAADQAATDLREIILADDKKKLVDFVGWDEINNLSDILELVELAFINTRIEVLKFILHKWSWLCKGEKPIVLFMPERIKLFIQMLSIPNREQHMENVKETKLKMLDIGFFVSVKFLGGNRRMQILFSGEHDNVNYFGENSEMKPKVISVRNSNFIFEIYGESQLVFRIERFEKVYKLIIVIKSPLRCFISNLTDFEWHARQVGVNEYVKIEEIGMNTNVNMLDSEHLASWFSYKRDMSKAINTTVLSDDMLTIVPSKNTINVKRNYMILELSDYKLDDVILDDVDEVLVLNWLLQLLNGTKYLHNNGLIHMKLSPSNVMVFTTGERRYLKISNHWHASPKGFKYFGQVDRFTDPGLKDFPYANETNDVYSLGKLFLWVITRGNMPLLPNFNDFENMNQSDKFTKLISSMLASPSSTRPKIEECIRAVHSIIKK